MPDKDGYPTEEELKKIETWDFNRPIEELLDFLESIWWMSDWGFKRKNGRIEFSKKKCIKLELHTAGWSGNEDIIRSLQKLRPIWWMYWVSSHRGGHYYFEIPMGAKRAQGNNGFSDP